MSAKGTISNYTHSCNDLSRDTLIIWREWLSLVSSDLRDMLDIWSEPVCLLSAGNSQFTSSPLSLKSLLSVWLAACLALQLYYVYFSIVLFKFIQGSLRSNNLSQFLTDARSDIWAENRLLLLSLYLIESSLRRVKCTAPGLCIGSHLWLFFPWLCRYNDPDPAILWTQTCTSILVGTHHPTFFSFLILRPYSSPLCDWASRSLLPR